MEAWLHAVAAAYAAGAETWVHNGIMVHRVAGGANNALYQVEAESQQVACKLCVADERHRAAREYGALELLERAGRDLAPQPLLLDESCTILPFPAVVYRWLPGKPLGPSVTAEQLDALLDSIQRIHSLRRAEWGHNHLPQAWFHWFDFAPYLAELNHFLTHYGGWLAAHGVGGQVLRDRLGRLVDQGTRTVATTTADPESASVAVCLCRVDPNLANTVWDGAGSLRWVDWEYSGWGDPALDLADVRWHEALAGLSEAQHRWLRDHYVRPAGDPSFEMRLAVWDHLLATRWPFLILRGLWSAYNGSDRVRLSQPDRDPEELYVRLVRTIERAEQMVLSTP